MIHGSNKQVQRLNSQFLNVSPQNHQSHSPSSIPSLPNIERSHPQSVSSISSLVLNRNPEEKWIHMQMKRDKMKNLPMASIVTSSQRDRDNSQQALNSERQRLVEILNQKGLSQQHKNYAASLKYAGGNRQRSNKNNKVK